MAYSAPAEDSAKPSGAAVTDRLHKLGLLQTRQIQHRDIAAALNAERNGDPQRGFRARTQKEKPTVKRKAPVSVTGGGGFRYENAVAARFLLDLLAGTNNLGDDFGRIGRIDWQARDAGWLLDDLAVSCTHSGADRSAGISIKSDQQVTRGGFPAAFVDIAWAQWLGVGTQRRIREGRDGVVLVTGSLAREVGETWSGTLSEVLETTPERMAARLTAPEGDEGSQSSHLQRALVESFRCPETLRDHGDSNHLTVMRLLRHTRLLHFDYDEVPSRDHGLALDDCQRLLRSGGAAQAQSLWDRIADAKRSTGGSIDLAGLLVALRGEFDLRDHPDYRNDWEALEHNSRDAMADIRTEIAGLPPLARAADRTKIQDRLDAAGACFLVGESGSGKSALAKTTALARYPRVIWITENTLDYDNRFRCEQGLGIDHPLVEILSAAPDPCLLVFDGIEKYSARSIGLAAACGISGSRYRAVPPWPSVTGAKIVLLGPFAVLVELLFAP